MASRPGWFVVFYCPSAKLIIELDGNPHGEFAKISEDLKRVEYLEKLGYKTLNNHPGPEVAND